MRSSWIICVGPKANDKDTYKRHTEEGPTGSGGCGEGRVETEAETEVMQPQAKGILEPPEAGRGKEGSSPRAFRGITVLSTPSFQTSSLQNCKRIKFCCFKPLSLWSLVMPAPGNKYNHDKSKIPC